MDLRSLRQAFEYVEETIAAGPLVPEVSAATIRSHLRTRYSFTTSVPLQTVVADVEGMLSRWQVQVTHPRYFGLFNPSVTFASVAADTLVAMYNPQLANWRTSPAANELERHTLQWLAGRFGLPSDTAASFTSGGMEANFSAVVVALTHAFPSYGRDGLRGLSAAPAVYLSEGSHHGFLKIAHMTGLGREAMRLIPVDRQQRLDLAALEHQIVADRASGWAPFMVVANAGSTGTGAIDPLPALAEFSRTHKVWFHVDAAWGGAAIVSPTLRNHLLGIEAADSITCDAHKWFSVSMGAGMFFCRHPARVAEAFRAEVSYMPGANTPPEGDDVTNPFCHSVQWSRRFIGLKLFLSLAELGEAGYAAMIEHQTAMGDVLREALTETGWDILNSTPLPLVCFNRRGLSCSVLLAALRERQIAWLSETSIAGEQVMRACITSFHTTEADVRWVVDVMNQLFLSQQARSGSDHEITEAAERERPVLL